MDLSVWAAPPVTDPSGPDDLPLVVPLGILLVLAVIGLRIYQSRLDKGRLHRGLTRLQVALVTGFFLRAPPLAAAPAIRPVDPLTEPRS